MTKETTQQKIKETPTEPQAPIINNIFNTEELSDFVEEGKANLCSTMLEHLFEELKKDGISESDLIFGMVQYCRKRQHPKKLIDSLQNSASDLWFIGQNLPVPDAE